MTKEQKEKIKNLLEKYNDVLLVSMRLAISEDFVNLVIANGDDSDFELKDLINQKETFSNYVLKEFLKQNSSSVISDLKLMEEPKIELRKSKLEKD